jgi:hypothetical protein
MAVEITDYVVAFCWEEVKNMHEKNEDSGGGAS